jgi:hypothetical protein
MHYFAAWGIGEKKIKPDRKPDRRLYRSSLVDDFAIKYSPEEEKNRTEIGPKKFGPIDKGLIGALQHVYTIQFR